LGGTFYCSGAGADSHEEALGLATLEIESVTRDGKGLTALALWPGCPVVAAVGAGSPGCFPRSSRAREHVHAAARGLEECEQEDSFAGIPEASLS